MRALLVLVAVLLSVHVGLLLLRPAGSSEQVGHGPRVGIVFDMGGRGDKSFNDGAYVGAMRAVAQLGAQVRFVEPGEGSDREAGLRLLAAEGMDLVLGVGFIFSDDLMELAVEYPQTAFAGIDFAVPTGNDGKPVTLPKNLAALKFREEQGSYLMGALAALSSPNKKIGFVGGMDTPLIHKFEVGYKAGAKRVCPECEVVIQYAGVTPEAFRNPGKGKELGLSQYQHGVDIIYHAAGSTGLGVFEAARAMKKRAIGVDSDQWAEAPGVVMTSMVKQVDTVVYEAVAQVKAKQFSGGMHQFGLAEGGVGYVYDDHNRGDIDPQVRKQVEELKALIIAGQIAVPSERR
jgi:basic membrane protein A